MDRPDLRDDPDLLLNDDRQRNAVRVYRELEKWSRSRTTAQAMEKLHGAVPCAPVHFAADIAADPHVQARRMIQTVDHPSGRTVDIAGAPIKFSAHEDTSLRRAPLLGEHTMEILGQEE
jgi:crotonobetainyl-CoA:carnitine CoA-transferase CaiB-like acyl-CoA transferase